MNVVRRRAAVALVALCVLAAAPAVRADDPKDAAAEEGTPSTPPKRPVDMDGVLLADGRQIEGSYEEKAGERWLIQPKAGGAPLNMRVTDIVVAEKGGELDVRGDASSAHSIWRDALHAEHCDALEDVVKECKAASLVERARAVLKRMEAEGAAKARIARLATGLDGLTQPNPIDPLVEDPVKAKDEAATAALIDGLGKGVDWCAKRGFPTAAQTLLNEIGRLDPKRADLDERTKAVMPESFFFKDKPDALPQWRVWAEALLPSSAEFVAAGDEPWERLENAPWTDGQTLGFRTRNVLLFIRDQTPPVCGKALRLAEGTVRALQLFLHDGEPDAINGDISRLEIRIHKNREDYLAESPARGKKAEAWTAGYFSPAENRSNFYVDHRSPKGAPDMEELTRVLTHEFTHHYMTARWANRKITAQGAVERSGGPGFFVVEGMAEFVQYQMHRYEERGIRFDDDFVPGNVLTACARRSGVGSKLLGLERFIDETQADFQGLSDDFLGIVKLRKGQTQPTSERHLWYAQAGTLCYFFLQKKGPEMRKKFVEYAERHYAGHAEVPGWKFLGYASAQEFESDFGKFLTSIAN